MQGKNAEIREILGIASNVLFYFLMIYGFEYNVCRACVVYKVWFFDENINKTIRSLDKQNYRKQHFKEQCLP